MKAYCQNCGGGVLTCGLLIQALDNIYLDGDEAESWHLAAGDAEKLFCDAVCLWNWVMQHRHALEQLQRLSRAPRIVQ